MSVRLWFLPSYRPVFGGVRHRTRRLRKPRIGTVVQMLCGASYVVGQEHRKPQATDCNVCESAHRDGRP